MNLAAELFLTAFTTIFSIVIVASILSKVFGSDEE